MFTNLMSTNRVTLYNIHVYTLHNTHIYILPISRPLTQLASQVELIVNGIEKQLYDKNEKSRQSCFSLLGELVTVLPGCLAPYIDLLLPAIHKSLRYFISCFLYLLFVSFERSKMFNLISIT